jgi:GTP diphosphokinase / guanosine-3',5'-bis(diphosphate) 3'-diphosphatase
LTCRQRLATIDQMNELDLVIRAAAFAAEKHRDQRRKDENASPYINHPIALASVLSSEAGISDVTILAAALLHDTIEDTETSPEELRSRFGADVASVVQEVTDDRNLPAAERKRLQIEHAAHISDRAKQVKLADKISNLRDINSSPPHGWSIDRKRQYFDWAKQVVDRLRGVNATLEHLFDEAYARRP